MVRKTRKSKFSCNGRRIPFRREDSWSFNNEYARNGATFGVNNSSSPHTNNWKNNCLLLGETPTQTINNSSAAAEKWFSIKCSKVNAKFHLILPYDGDESYLYINKTKIYKFKVKENISWY